MATAADAAVLQAPAFTDVGCSRWSTPWRSSSRASPASASASLPTPSTPLSHHTSSKPTMLSSPRRTYKSASRWPPVHNPRRRRSSSSATVAWSLMPSSTCPWTTSSRCPDPRPQ